jgi:hypothetical protein
MRAHFRTRTFLLQNQPGRPAKSTRASCKTNQRALQNQPGRLAKLTAAQQPSRAWVTFGRKVASKTLPSSGMGRFHFPDFGGFAAAIAFADTENHGRGLL